MSFVPQRLREAREAMRDNGRPVSQDRFASLIGVSRRSPGRWENGEAEPRMAQLARIAEVTGRPVGFFFDDFDGAMTARAHDLADSVRMFADLLDAVREGRVEIRPREEVAA